MPAEAKQFGYEIEILSEAGQSLGRRRVEPAALAAAHEQTRFLADRRGKLPADDYEQPVREQPVFAAAETTGRISGLSLSVGEGRDGVERVYGIDLFEPSAQRFRSELGARNQLGAGEETRFRVFAAQGGDGRQHGTDPPRVRRKPFPVIDGQLRHFLAGAIRQGPPLADDYPVLILDAALAQAEALTFRRAEEEHSAWLIGNLCRQQSPDPEIFAVIHTVIEARGAQLDRYRIDFTTETFTDVDRQLAKRRQRLGRRGEMKLGFFHTHPFLPSVLDGREACPHCALRQECSLTSSFFSQRDARFHAAVFGRDAHAVELVLGLTPREERDLRMFCLDGGVFRERGFYRIPQLPPRETPLTGEMIHNA